MASGPAWQHAGVFKRKSNVSNQTAISRRLSARFNNNNVMCRRFISIVRPLRPNHNNTDDDRFQCLKNCYTSGVLSHTIKRGYRYNTSTVKITRCDPFARPSTINRHRASTLAHGGVRGPVGPVGTDNNNYYYC